MLSEIKYKKNVENFKEKMEQNVDFSVMYIKGRNKIIQRMKKDDLFNYVRNGGRQGHL